VKKYRTKSTTDGRKTGNVFHGIRKKSMRLSAKINHAIKKPGIVDEAFVEIEKE